MDKFVRLEGLVVAIDRNNIDTDAIIPKQFLKSIKRSGFGPNAFDEWRYMDVGQPGEDCINRPKNPNFALNQPRYQGAQILLTRQNFGCGSSREHAPWALLDFGFRVIVAESFADIFFNNCFKNGILPIVLPANEIEEIVKQVEAMPGYKLTVDLPAQTVTRPDGRAIAFNIDPFRKECLLNGWDDIGLTLRHSEKICEFEARRRFEQPWLFA
ncbi:MAG: 3-isopropylmalate dehydratase, small subunit [Proteobacteria bacterium]|nr:3-isopropylmalate dehydratase, small subunit [Pseudomonadota bacterium]